MNNRTTLLLLILLLLLSCSEENHHTPEVEAPLEAEILTNLSEPSTNIDYLVIAPDQLIQAGRKLCSFHNLDTDDDVNEAAVISLSSIMELYPGDTIAALTSFLSTNPKEWKTLPKYVILLGDEKLHNETPGIPVYKVPEDQPNWDEYYDNIYLDPDKDKDINYIIARIPIRSESEMDQYLLKIKRFMANSQESIFFAVDNSAKPSFPEWMKFNGYDYDVPDEFPISSKSRSIWQDLPFADHSEQMHSTLKPTGWNIKSFYIDAFLINYDSLLSGIDDSTLMVSKGENFFITNRDLARKDFFTKANQNHKLQVHLGHAAPEQFAMENIYSFKDTALFTTPSVILHMGCFSAEFTSDSSMTQKLMFSSKGGPIALLGCPYENFNSPASGYIKNYLASFVAKPNLTVGDLFAEQFSSRSYARYFILLGDPALRIN